MSRQITEEIIAALKAGNHAAFDAVFLSFYDKIKFFVGGFVRSQDTAEEITQELFMKVWDNRAALDPGKSFSSYMYTLARNASLNFIKHKYTESSYLSQLPHDPQSESSEELIFASEIQLLIDMSVAAMPEQRRKIYVMSRNEGISNDKIAQQLGVSKKTVENQLSLALKEIKRVVSSILLFFV